MIFLEILTYEVVKIKKYHAIVKSSLKYKWIAGIYHSFSGMSSLLINFKNNTFHTPQSHQVFYFLLTFFPITKNLKSTISKGF